MAIAASKFSNQGRSFPRQVSKSNESSAEISSLITCFACHENTKVASKINVHVGSTFDILDDGIKHKWWNDQQCVEVVNRIQNSGFKMRRRVATEPIIEYLEAISE